MNTCKRYIIGFGNYARDDDGIGLRVVEHIVEKSLDKGFDAVEAGNDGMRLLTYFAETTGKILIVDCALVDLSAGDWMIFDIDDASSRKKMKKMSTHDGDLLALYDNARKMNFFMPKIKVMAIQPESLSMNMTLSSSLASRVPEYAAAAIEEIGKD